MTNKFKDILKELKQEKGYGQVELAQKLGE